MDMPEVLRIGKLKFIIRPERNVRHNRPHVHVERAECGAVFSLDDPIECLGNSGFHSSDITRIGAIVEQFQDLFLEEWSKINEE